MALSISEWRRVPEEFREKAYHYWIETGSLTGAQKRLESEGFRNSNGRPYAVSQVITQAHVYLLDNFQDKPLINDFNADRERLGAAPLTQEEFEQFLVLKAITIWAKKNHAIRFWEWVEKNKFEKYAHLWEGLIIKPRPVGRPSRSIAAPTVTKVVSE